MIQLNKKYILSEIGIDKASPEPIHLQLYKSLKQTIIRHRLESGFNMPSERSLANEFDLNRNTVHRAYESLREDGFVCARPGSRGLFIAEDAQVLYRRPFPTIGVILPNKFSEYVNPQFPQRFKYISGITDRAAELNYSTMMIQLPDPDESTAFVENWIKHVIDRMDGIIHLGERGLKHDSALEMLWGYDLVPQVFISAFCGKPEIGSIVADTSPGALAAAELLCEKGHQNIGTVGVHSVTEDYKNKLCEYESDRRLQRVLECFQSVGLNVMEDCKLYQCDSVIKIEERLKVIYSKPVTPTAFWCENDDIALMTIEALGNIGLKVPEDVSVIGYDNLLPNSRTASVTTIRIPFYSIGCKAVDVLVNYHENNVKATGQVIKLPTSLVLKDSVAKAKA